VVAYKVFYYCPDCGVLVLRSSYWRSDGLMAECERCGWSGFLGSCSYSELED